MEGVFGAGAILRPFPWLFHVMTATPVWMLKIAMPALVGTARVRVSANCHSCYIE